jgi:nucleotide-binding universal stress UspA family protein
MAYPTILVHVDESARSAERVGLAAQLALRGAAHLIGVAPTGVSRFLYHSMPPDKDDATLALHLDMLRAQSRSVLAAFEAQCQGAGVASFEARVIDDEAGAGINLHGRAADLIVVGQGDLATHVISGSGRPVLVAPHACSASAVGRRVLVAWDGGREAARALQLALPLLQMAEQVDIAVIDTGPDAVAEARAADPLPYLERHGIKARMAVHALGGKRHAVGNALLRVAADGGADVLVMGAYGHSRMRETILGGVTRTIFEEMRLPVLMVH